MRLSIHLWRPSSFQHHRVSRRSVSYQQATIGLVLRVVGVLQSYLHCMQMTNEVWSLFQHMEILYECAGLLIQSETFYVHSRTLRELDGLFWVHNSDWHEPLYLEWYVKNSLTWSAYSAVQTWLLNLSRRVVHSTLIAVFICYCQRHQVRRAYPTASKPWWQYRRSLSTYSDWSYTATNV